MKWIIESVIWILLTIISINSTNKKEIDTSKDYVSNYTV